MKLYAVTRMLGFQSTPRSFRFAWPYQESFHGRVGPVVNRYGKRPYTPLPLTRNLRLTPPVYCPFPSLVVSEKLAGKIAQIREVDLSHCVWDRVYDEPVDEQSIRDIVARFSVIDEAYNQWLGSRMKPPTRSISLPNYFEVLAPPLDAVRGSLPCSTVLRFPPVIGEEIQPAKTCAALHEEYPITMALPYYLFTEKVYPLIEVHVSDRDLFTVVEFEVSG